MEQKDMKQYQQEISDARDGYIATIEAALKATGLAIPEDVDVTLKLGEEVALEGCIFSETKAV